MEKLFAELERLTFRQKVNLLNELVTLEQRDSKQVLQVLNNFGALARLNINIAKQFTTN